jgi:hypothetical protein
LEKCFYCRNKFYVFVDSSRKELQDQPSVDLNRNKLMESTILLTGAEINLWDPPIC